MILGKLCGKASSLNPFSSCKGPALSDDIESFVVMPGEFIAFLKLDLVNENLHHSRMI